MRTNNYSMVLLSMTITVWQAGCSSQFADDTERMNTLKLMSAAAAAYEGERAEDARFLFFAGLTQFSIDKQVYPPVHEGGESPGVLKAAMSALVGGPISKDLESNPTAFANASKRLAKWSPKFDVGYDPGWKYSNALGSAAAARIVAAQQKEVLALMEVRVKLLGNLEYRRLADEVKEATKVEQRYLNATKESTVINPVPEDLTKKFEAVQRKKLAAAKRMKDIEWDVDPKTRWHARLRWKAADYFDDKQVVALCHAIEQDDVTEMERQIAAGANVNAIGKDGMTPLLWAFPDGKLDRFECLLKHGADPNVVIQSDFRTSGLPFHLLPDSGMARDNVGCHAGDSVMLLAARSPIIDYLKLVLAHGGNPNQVNERTKEAPLDAALKEFLSDCDERVAILLAKGADPNRYCERRKGYPATHALRINRYDVALDLLKAGADPKLYQPSVISNVASVLDGEKWKAQYLEGKRASDYKALIEWLEQHRKSLEATRENDAASQENRSKNREHEEAANPSE